jgi:hypothetical protein
MILWSESACLYGADKAERAFSTMNGDVNNGLRFQLSLVWRFGESEPNAA